MRQGSLLRVYALKPLINNLNLKDCTILDIGGFDGLMASILRNDNKANIVIMDLNESGLRHARQMNLNVLLGTALQIPAQMSSVDGVICLDVIEHILEDQKAIHEIARVTKPGGILFLTTTADDFYLPLISKKWLNSKWGHLRNGYSDNELEDILRQGGFKVLKRGRYFNFLSRLSYSLLFFYRFPPVPIRFRERIFERIIRLEPRIKWGALEHWIIGVRENESTL